MIVWALFDSGNGCYKQAADKINEQGGQIELYSIGLDRENKNDHFIPLNLSDYGYMFNNNILWETLDKLPKPDLIIASPPCESWSVASAMRGGNACWKQEFREELPKKNPLSRFTLRDYSDFDGLQYDPDKSLLRRINGELCIYNTVHIIKKYEPSVYIIENPAYGRIWDYTEKILGFEIPYENQTFYNNYVWPVKKPTKFKSNINLDLLKKNIKNEVDFQTGFSHSYNERSNIPEKLVDDIFKKVIEHLNQNNDREEDIDVSNIYAIRKGKKTGIFNTWDEANEQIKGFSNAEFKKFNSADIDEALAYLIEVPMKEHEQNVHYAYVDGSNLRDGSRYSGSAIIVHNGSIIDELSMTGANQEYIKKRNIAGELLGALLAIKYGLDNCLDVLVICHDYVGIGKWATGEFKARDTLARLYKQQVDQCKELGLELKFIKVDGHTGHEFNERADQVAKKALGL